jgi:ABC-type nitrate/sulfonate/bicarbonate transport system permease component
MSGTLGIKAARIAIVLAVFALWEMLSRTGIVNPRLLPSASDTLAMLGELLQRAGVRNDLVVTASEVATAFILAVPLNPDRLSDRGEPLLRRGDKTAAVLRLQ